MNSSATTGEITKAIIAVMKATKGIEKNLNVGSGNSSYKGVSDQDVKKEIGKSMEQNGLAIVPIDIEPQFQIDRWEQEEFYNGKSNGIKQKQQVFTSVKTKYLLMHISGEWLELSGYGHGVDTQDKAAGKATTYALKYALLYTFMVPTGKIDDADNDPSSDHSLPPAKQAPVKVKEELIEGSDKWLKAVNWLMEEGNTIEKLKGKYTISAENEGKLKTLIQNKAASATA